MIKGFIFLQFLDNSIWDITNKVGKSMYAHVELFLVLQKMWKKNLLLLLVSNMITHEENKMI